MKPILSLSIAAFLFMHVDRAAFGREDWEVINPALPSEAFNDIIWTGKKLIAVGKYGSMISSTDGINWNRWNSGTRYHLNAISGNAQILVAVGDTGMIITSEDEGKTWIRRTAYCVNIFNDIIWTGTQFVIVGIGSQRSIVTSSDGISWVVRNPPPYIHHLTSVAWTGTQIAAVDFDGEIITSSDGANWNYAQTIGVDHLRRLLWGANEYITVGGDYVSSTNPHYAVTIGASADGVKWKNSSSEITGILYDVCWTGSHYVGVGWDRKFLSEYKTNLVVTSPNGSDWTIQKSIGSMVLYSIAWTGKQLVAVGENGCIIRSTDQGITWSYSASLTLAHLNGVAWGRNRFVAVGDHGTLLSSSDGKLWNSGSFRANKSLHAIAWGNNTFVAVGDSGTVVTSPDGISWTEGSIATSQHLLCIAWSEKPQNKKFVAFGTPPFSGVKLFPAFLSADGKTWDSASISGDKRVNAVAANQERFVAGGINIVLSSPNGIKWQTNDYTGTPYSIEGMCCDGKEFFCVKQWPTSCIDRSTDGLDWTNATQTGEHDFRAITYSKAGFAAVGGIKSRAGLAVSPNGLNWRYSAIESIPVLKAVCWGANTFVAVGDQGTIIIKRDSVSSMEKGTALKHFQSAALSISKQECSYSIPAPSHVSLTMHDLRGRIVSELVNGAQAAGNHKAIFPKALPQGRYIISLKAGLGRKEMAVIIIH